MSKEFSRRDFVKGVAVGAAGLALSPALGACLPNETLLKDLENIPIPKPSPTALPALPDRIASFDQGSQVLQLDLLPANENQFSGQIAEIWERMLGHQEEISATILRSLKSKSEDPYDIDLMAVRAEGEMTGAYLLASPNTDRGVVLLGFNEQKEWTYPFGVPSLDGIKANSEFWREKTKDGHLQEVSPIDPAISRVETESSIGFWAKVYDTYFEFYYPWELLALREENPGTDLVLAQNNVRFAFGLALRSFQGEIIAISDFSTGKEQVYLSPTTPAEPLFNWRL
ncbi:MAG: twin-arginine translocation signal domain-containing protein [Candidatus Shapirobacteria bacterium]